MPPVMHPVYSSNVTAVGHDAAAQEMHVTWKSGKTSVYSNVPAAKADEVRRSHSVGQAVRDMIIPHHDHRYAGTR